MVEDGKKVMRIQLLQVIHLQSKKESQMLIMLKKMAMNLKDGRLMAKEH